MITTIVILFFPLNLKHELGPTLDFGSLKRRGVLPVPYRHQEVCQTGQESNSFRYFQYLLLFGRGVLVQTFE